MNLIAQIVGYFRRKQPYMTLHMDPADHIVGMTPYRDNIVVISRDGKIYLLTPDEWLR